MINCQERLQREYAEMENNPIENINAIPIEGDLRNWDCVIIGPPATPYENGVFYLSLSIPDEYPHKPPQVRFRNHIYHPNIDDCGNICVSTLKEDWKPILTISQVLLSISSLFVDPNPGDPLKPDVAKMYTEKREHFEYIAREWTKLYASQ